MDTDKTTDFTYVDAASELPACLETLRREPLLAIDMEADSYHHYYPKVCLIQCTANGANFIIDPLAGLDLSPLMDVFAQKPLILHDAGYDLRMLKADFNFCPREPIIDTMLAAKLLGYERVGLSNMLLQYFGVDVSKHNQKADWSRRPLDPHLLAYAAEDTSCLPALWVKLKAELESKGRLDWHRQYCEFTTQTALEADLSRNGDDEDRWRIRGIHKLEPRQMAFFRELWHWRENEAQKVDLPPFRIFENTRLMELSVLAAAGKTSHKDFARLLPRTCRGRRLEAMRKAIRKAEGLTPSEYPLPKKGDVAKRLTTGQLRQVDRLKAECTRIADELELPSQLIASRGVLEWIVKKHITDPDVAVEKRLLMPWQADLLRPTLEPIMSHPKED